MILNSLGCKNTIEHKEFNRVFIYNNNKRKELQ